MAEFFTEVSEPIRYAGPDSNDPLTFRWYDADRMVGERTMAEHLRIAVCYWHSFTSRPWWTEAAAHMESTGVRLLWGTARGQPLHRAGPLTTGGSSAGEC